MTQDAKPRIFSNTAMLTLGLVVNTLVGLYITRSLARYLGVADYGAYALAFVYLNFTAVITNFGFDTILIRELARERENTDNIITAGIVLKLLFAIAAFFAGVAYVLSRSFSPEYNLALVLLLLTHFVSAFDTFETVHKARLRGGSVVAGSVISQLLTLGVVLWGREQGWPLEWLIISHLFVRIPRAGFWGMRLLATDGFRWRWEPAKAKFILRESAVIGVSGLLWIVYFRVDTLMLEWMKGAEAVGQYAAAYKFVEMALLGSGLVMTSLGPLLAERWPKSPSGFQWLYQQTIDYMGMIGALMAGVMVVLGPDLIGFIFSPQFTDAIAILRILSVATVIIYLSNATGSVMVAVGIQSKGFLTCRLVGMVLNVAFNLWWIPRWGGYGAAWATVVSEGTILLIAPLFIRTRTGTIPSLWTPACGFVTVMLAWWVYLGAGGGRLEATWPGRLAGLGVLLVASAVFAFFHRRQFRELFEGISSWKVLSS